MRLYVFISLMLILANVKGQSDQNVFIEAYKYETSDSLLSVFKKWNNSIDSDQSEVRGIVSEVYSVYNEFYSPFDMQRIGDSEWGDSIYNNRFALVQNTIAYSVKVFANIDTIKVLDINGDTISILDLRKKYSEESAFYRDRISNLYPKSTIYEKITITDFRPETNIPSNKRLYLNSIYEKQLREFLGNTHSRFGKGGFMNPAAAKDESKNKQVFLNPYLKAIHGHWGGYWHLETHPLVSVIIFNPSFDKAYVYFRIAYEGGRAYFEKENNKWKLVKSELTWIQ